VKAAVLEKFGEPLAIKAVPDPAIGAGEVLVDVIAAGVLPYTAEIFSGARHYPLEPPVRYRGWAGSAASSPSDPTQPGSKSTTWCGVIRPSVPVTTH